MSMQQWLINKYHKTFNYSVSVCTASNSNLFLKHFLRRLSFCRAWVMTKELVLESFFSPFLHCDCCFWISC